MDKQNETEAEMEGYDERKTKWEAVKEDLLGKKENYTKLKQNLVGYITKESDLNGWIGKAEDVCERMKDIQQGENSKEIFKTFEVGSNFCWHVKKSVFSVTSSYPLSFFRNSGLKVV